MRQETIAVTGASGHIGNTVCRRLLELGYAVKAFYQQDDRALLDIPVQKVQGDVLSVPDLGRLVSGCDMVIHCAAVISINGDPTGRVFTTNTEGVKNLLAVSAAAGVRRIIHLSSTHAVQERPHELPFDETRPYKGPDDYPYDYSKAMGEQWMLQTDIPGKPEVIVLRPSSAIGPFDYKPSELGKALLDLYHRKIPVLPAGGYNFVDVRDVAASVVAALQQGRPGEVYLLSGRYYTLKDFAAVVELVSGKAAPRLTLPFGLLRAMLPVVTAYARWQKAAPVFTRDAIDALYHGHPAMDNSKAVRELGHTVRPLEVSIRDFFTWKNMPLPGI